MVDKVANINKIRQQKSKELVANGEVPLDPYTFDYLLLCNKICGASHYNMQMKIVVVEKSEFNDWLGKKATINQVFFPKDIPSNEAETTKQDSLVIAQNLK
jgi:cytochrome c oxidase subunit 2